MRTGGSLAASREFPLVRCPINALRVGDSFSCMFVSMQGVDIDIWPIYHTYMYRGRVQMSTSDQVLEFIRLQKLVNHISQAEYLDVSSDVVIFQLEQVYS
jgi:hypothetical protein